MNYKIIGYIAIALVAILLTYFFGPQKTIFIDAPLSQEEILSYAVDHQNFLIMAQRQYIESIQSNKTESLKELTALGGIKERHTNPDKFFTVQCDFQTPGSEDITSYCQKIPVSVEDPRKMTLEGRKEIAQEKTNTGATISE